MTFNTNALFLVAAIGMGIWLYKDKGFRKREFFLTMLFAVIVFATPWGNTFAGQAQQIIGSGFNVVGDTMNSLG